MKRIAIIQSNYIPWKGYFDIIGAVDEFIFLDDVQYTKRDWRNRNKVKTSQGSRWMSIPVETKGKYLQTIQETQIQDRGWAQKHLDMLRQNYSKAAFYKEYWPVVEGLYKQLEKESALSVVNQIAVKSICDILGIETPLVLSSNLSHEGEKEQRLISLCKAVNATHYVSGPAAKDYITDGVFEKAGITLEYMDYSGYPEYKQLWGDFDHYITVLDLIFNTGQAAPDYMKFKTQSTDRFFQKVSA